METNPYRSKEKRLVKKDKEWVSKVCFSKGGIMFKLFDLGRLCFEDDKKVWVFKNVIGDTMREFAKRVEEGQSDYSELYGQLVDQVLKIGKLSLEKEDKYLLFQERVMKILEPLEG